ncbi:phage major capsid protein [Streptomyces erythrochromogenes]|uniref:phage major capsid protein n=1 Tax=Streptomyces erythrochromogenes TaxID=285574 RepID=UPI002251F717|nr:phage major capsid protein [Streptomyces erythrochromogenes]MCX5584277.1 phage major capsid protein [Streptomyces erythrochromogenes]
MIVELSHSQAVIRLSDIQAELERLGEKPELTSEDEQSFDELTREFADVDNHRRQLERKSALERVRSATKTTERRPAATRIEGGTPTSARDGYDLDPVLHPDSVEDQRFRNPWDLSEVRTFGQTKGQVARELRARSLSAIERMGGANDAVRQAATNIVERWDDGDSRLAKLCLATSSPEYMRAWSKCAAGKGHMITPDEQRALERAMSLTDSAGGYLVPFQLDPTVIITANGSTNPLRQAARKVVATGDVWNGVSSGAVSWSWDAEATEVSDDTTTFAQPTVPVHKAQGFVPISIEALEDEANVTQEVARLLAFGKDTLESAAFITGSGSGQPTGLVTALAGGSSEVAPTTVETFAAADVYKMDNALPARYRANASWVANRAIYNLIRQFDTSGGSQMWERIGADVPPMLVGRPALEAEDMDGTFSAAATANNYILAYGDLSNYVIADRVGMTVEFIPHLFATGNNRPSGQRGWYAYYRVGADVVNDGGIRLLNVATTA